jgi:hypothetical protein
MSDRSGALGAEPIALGRLDAGLTDVLGTPAADDDGGGGVTFVDEVGNATEPSPGRRKLSLSGTLQGLGGLFKMRGSRPTDGADDEAKEGTGEIDGSRTFTKKPSSSRMKRVKRGSQSTEVSLVDVLHEAECYRGVGAFGRFFVFFFFNCLVIWMHWTYHTGPFASSVQEGFKGYGDAEHTADTNTLADVVTMFDAIEFQLGYVNQALDSSMERLPEALRGTDARPARFYPGNQSATWGAEQSQVSAMTPGALADDIAARRVREAGANLGVYVGEHSRVHFAWLRAEFNGDARQHPALARRIDANGYFHRNASAPDRQRVWQFMPHAKAKSGREETSAIAAAIIGENIPREKSKKLRAELLLDAPILCTYAEKLVLELLITNQIDGKQSLFTMGFSTVYRLPNGHRMMALPDSQTTSLHTAQSLYKEGRDSVRAVLEVILVLLFLHYLIDEVQDVRISNMQHRSRAAHLRSGWNILDLVSNLWLFGMISWYAAILASDRRDLQVPSTYAASMVEYDAHSSEGPATLGGGWWRINTGNPGAYASPAVETGRWPGATTFTQSATNFVASRTDASVRMAWLFAMVFSAFLVGLRLLKYMRFHKGLGIFTDLFRSAWIRMKDFAVIFLFFLSLLGFMLTSFFELSGGNPHFTTMAGTMAQLARLTFGFMDYDDFLNQRLGMSEFDFVSAIIFWVIIVFMFVIAQNIVLAIVVDAYEDVNVGHDDMGFLSMVSLRISYSFKCFCNRTGIIKRWVPKEGKLCWESATMHEVRWSVASHPALVAVLAYFKDFATNRLYRTSRWLDEVPEDPNDPAIMADEFSGRRPWHLEEMKKGDLIELFSIIKTSNLARCMDIVPTGNPYFPVDYDAEELAELCMKWEVHPSTHQEEPHLNDHTLEMSMVQVNDNVINCHDDLSKQIQALTQTVGDLAATVAELRAEKAAAAGEE